MLVSAAVHVAADVFFLDGVALVVLFLAAGEGDDELCVAVFGDEELDGYDCEAFLGVFGLEVAQLALCEE